MATSTAPITWAQRKGTVLFTIVLSVVATVVIGFIIKATIGLRSSEESESAGLDTSDHGEEAYHQSA